MDKITAIDYVFKYITTGRINGRNAPVVPQNDALNAIERARKEGYKQGVEKALELAAEKATVQVKQGWINGMPNYEVDRYSILSLKSLLKID